MCFTMNNAQIDNVEDMKNVPNESIREHLNTQFIANEVPYLNERFDSRFVNDQQNINFTDVKMEDLNWQNEPYNNWISYNTDVAVHDINRQDDNLCSNYSEFNAAQQYQRLAEHNLLDPYSRQLYNYEMKYDPSELLLIPPSRTEMHFNYNIPATSSQLELLRSHSYIYPNSTTVNNNNMQPPPLYSNHSHVSNSPTAARASSNFSINNAHSNRYTHPNMWHPNASFGAKSNRSTHGRNFNNKMPEDGMLDVYQVSNSNREARNQAEKNRRDKLNGSIQELSTIVPHVAESPRRVDKTAVLRFAAHGLRLRYIFGKSANENEPKQATDTLMKLLDSFFLTVACNGQIVLVSSSIEQHLGHCQTDLYGQNILNITHPEDHQLLKEKLIPKDLVNLLDIQPADETGGPRERTQAEEDEIDRRLREDKRSFTIRMAKSGSKSEPTAYCLVKIDGSFRRSDMAPRGHKTSTFPTALQLMRRNRGRGELMSLHTISGNDIVLVAIARIVRPPVINRAIEVNRLEYKTRHLIDGRIIDCDQRISLVAGYMTAEVRSLSPFTFIHQDDVRWVIVALRQMYDCSSSYGESTYRLFTRNGKIIYLHTKGFLEIDKNSNKVHSFVCVNSLLDEEEGKRRVESMKNKFSVIIDTKIPQSSDDLPASENPQQLENAVLCLIQNLKSDLDGDDSEDLPSTSSSATTSHHQQHTHTYQHYGNTSCEVGRSTKTPPIALVAPATDSIKTSITKSVNVVKTTAGKFLHPTTTSCTSVLDSNSGSDRQTDNMDNVFYLHNAESQSRVTNSEQEVSRDYTTSGTLKRKISFTISETDNDEYFVPVQRQAIENVLSSSLQQINNNLNEQLTTAMELRSQGQQFEVPNTEELIADIMKEHQIQQEMYENISNEFESQRNHIESDSNDTEALLKCLNNDLEEIQQPHNQQQQDPTQSMSTSTNLSSLVTNVQLTSENHLQT